MYTDDDEKVTVKEDNSNIKYADFYTSFNDIEKDNTKNKKSKKKVKPEPKNNQVKEESDYVDFYGDNESVDDNSNNNKKSPIKIIIIVVAIIIFIALLALLFSNNFSRVKGDIKLLKTDFTLKVGEKEYVSYNVIDTEESVTSLFKSSNTDVVVVNDNGEIIALSEGEAEVIVRYTIEGVTREKKCKVKVSGDGSTNQNISLNLKFEKGENNTWTNGDVIINPEASSVFEIASLKYAINCDSNCNYVDVLNKKITISNSGETKIKVIAKDKKNQEITKEVVVKIDREAPTATLVGSSNITSNKDVEVCVTCSDNLSGCKQNKVCKKYTESKTNQVITVEDKAGNKKSSTSFNVNIKKTSPCSLKVSSTGTVTATLNETATYYGFNSTYKGNNELSKKVTNLFQNGNSGAKIVFYYVKTKTSTGSCRITVIKKCSCNDGTSSCEKTCTYTSQ